MKAVIALFAILVTIGLVVFAAPSVDADAGCFPEKLEIQFADDYESYTLGENPTDFYDYRSFSIWAPPGPVWPDLFKVGQIGANQVLQYYSDGSSYHAPVIMKLYKQRFAALSEVRASFYHTTHSMGYNSVVFEYQDDQHFYSAGYYYDNRLYIIDSQLGNLAYVDLWTDLNIMEVDNRIELKRICDKLVATITRLDTHETRTVETVATQYVGGAAGFRSFEDWPGGLYVNVDDFYVKGTPAVEFADDYESYTLGENPTDFYDYRSFSIWAPPGPVWPDLFKVGQIGANQVLQYYSDGSSYHAPVIMKLYKQRFAALSEVRASFYHTTHSMGYNSVVFEYQDDQHFYSAGYYYDNRLYIIDSQLGNLAYVDLWTDLNIMEVDSRIELKRICDKLVATITRLDTHETRTVETVATQYVGGAAGFRSFEDWPGGLYVNVDDFSVKGTPAVEFADDYESYTLGENPTDFYDYRSFSIWAPPGPVWPDLFKVGQIGANQVLQYYSDGSSYHAPVIMKLYKQRFAALSEVRASFYRTTHSMGYNSVVFEYQDDQHFYSAGYYYDNRLYIIDSQLGNLAYVDLWTDLNIMEVDSRIELKRICDKLVATITRLDTHETRTVETVATQYVGGAAGFRSFEDWPGGLYVNVDDFYVKGIPFDCYAVTDVPQAECQALLTLYDSTKGSKWTHNSGWLTTGAACDWYGLGCAGRHVTEINLSDNGLDGNLPSEIHGLSHLQTLLFSDNSLKGALPQSAMSLDLETCHYNSTNLCEPPDTGFQHWLTGIPDLQRTGVLCAAYASTMQGQPGPSDLVVAWTHIDPNTSYEVYRSPTPYFTPAPVTHVATLPAPTNTWTDDGVISAGNQSFYILRSRWDDSANNLWSDDAPIGCFNYGLVPGQ